MKHICLTLPREHPVLGPLPSILEGHHPVSGTLGAILRLAEALAQQGHTVTLSAAQSLASSPWPLIPHDVLPQYAFDHIILHQSLSDMELPLIRASRILWLHNRTSWETVHGFLQKDQRHRVVVPSRYMAEVYRAVPEWPKRLYHIVHFPASAFHPEPEVALKRLLFVGAITPHSGFRETMRVFTHLALRVPDLSLAVAGSQRLHTEGSVGLLGVADPEFEAQEIQPWLAAFPAGRKPIFFGALAPVALRREIARSSAVLVNPDWHCPESFCLSAIEAEACGRPVFSAAAGALPETICRRPFDPLSTRPATAALVDRLVEGFRRPEMLRVLGKESLTFVQSRFSKEGVLRQWQALFSGADSDVSRHYPKTPRQWAYEVARRTGLGMPLHAARKKS